jgi:hypothetical protein
LIYGALAYPDLCSDKFCFAAKEGVHPYRDQHDLSMAGSNIVGQGFKRDYGLTINRATI